MEKNTLKILLINYVLPVLFLLAILLPTFFESFKNFEMSFPKMKLINYFNVVILLYLSAKRKSLILSFIVTILLFPKIEIIFFLGFLFILRALYFNDKKAIYLLFAVLSFLVIEHYQGLHFEIGLINVYLFIPLSLVILINSMERIITNDQMKWLLTIIVLATFNYESEGKTRDTIPHPYETIMEQKDSTGFYKDPNSTDSILIFHMCKFDFKVDSGYINTISPDFEFIGTVRLYNEYGIIKEIDERVVTNILRKTVFDEYWDVRSTHFFFDGFYNYYLTLKDDGTVEIGMRRAPHYANDDFFLKEILSKELVISLIVIAVFIIALLAKSTKNY